MVSMASISMPFAIKSARILRKALTSSVCAAASCSRSMGAPFVNGCGVEIASCHGLGLPPFSVAALQEAAHG